MSEKKQKNTNIDIAKLIIEYNIFNKTYEEILKSLSPFVGFNTDKIIHLNEFIWADTPFTGKLSFNKNNQLYAMKFTSVVSNELKFDTDLEQENKNRINKVKKYLIDKYPERLNSKENIRTVNDYAFSINNLIDKIGFSIIIQDFTKYF